MPGIQFILNEWMDGWQIKTYFLNVYLKEEHQIHHDSCFWGKIRERECVCVRENELWRGRGETETIRVNETEREKKKICFHKLWFAFLFSYKRDLKRTITLGQTFILSKFEFKNDKILTNIHSEWQLHRYSIFVVLFSMPFGSYKNIQTLNISSIWI